QDKQHLVTFWKAVDSFRTKQNGLTLLEEKSLSGELYKSFTQRVPNDVRDFLAHLLSSTADSDIPQLPVERAVDHVAGSIAEWRRQRLLVEEEESKAGKAQMRASENRTALKTILAGLWGPVIPEFDSTIGAVFEGFSGEAIDRSNDWIVNRDYRRWL